MPPAEPESHRYEVEIRVARPGQADAVISREYQSVDAASTDGAAGELWAGIKDGTLSRLYPVADGR